MAFASPISDASESSFTYVSEVKDFEDVPEAHVQYSQTHDDVIASE